MASVFGRTSMQHHSVSQGLLSDMGPGMHPRVSILGGQFRLVDEAGQKYGAPCVLRNTANGSVLQLLAVIIGSNPKRSRVFFENVYDPDNPGPPDCFSDNGLAPSVNASNPQARTCAECEWSKWGSDISVLTGKKIKACSEKRKIALMVIGDTTQRIYEMQIPPATLKNMAKYAAYCAQHSPPGESRKADVCDFITGISFVSGQTGVLEFQAFSWISSAYRDPDGTVRAAVDAQMQPLDAPDQGEAVGALIDEIWSGETLPLLLGLNDQPWTPPAQLSGPLPGMMGAGAPVQHAIAHQPSHTVPGAAPYAGSPFEPPAGRAPVQPAAAFPPPAAPSAQAPALAAPQQQQPAGQNPPPARATRGRKPRSQADAAGAAGGALSTGQAPFLGTTNPAPPATGEDIPDFLRRGRNSDHGGAPAGGPVHLAASASLQPAGGSGPDRATIESGQFGMVDAAPPPNDLAKTLGGVFALPVARN